MRGGGSVSQNWGDPLLFAPGRRRRWPPPPPGGGGGGPPLFPMFSPLFLQLFRQQKIFLSPQRPPPPSLLPPSFREWEIEGEEEEEGGLGGRGQRLLFTGAGPPFTGPYTGTKLYVYSGRRGGGWGGTATRERKYIFYKKNPRKNIYRVLRRWGLVHQTWA